MKTETSGESVQKKPRRSSAKKNVAEQKPQSKNGVFKIALTAVYNNTDMDADQIADNVFEAMTRVGKGLSLLHVDSVRKASKPDEEIKKILIEVSEQQSEAMSKVITHSGDPFVVIENRKE